MSLLGNTKKGESVFPLLSASKIYPLEIVGTLPQRSQQFDYKLAVAFLTGCIIQAGIQYAISSFYFN